MHEFGTALRDEVRAVLLLQTLHVGDVAEEHRALPARIDLARARNGVFLDVLEQFRDAAVGRIFFVVRPVPSENLVGLAAEEEIELLLEEAVELFARLLSEIGHLPAAELEALGRILSWPAGRLHDAVHGNEGADDYLPHGSLPLFGTLAAPHLDHGDGLPDRAQVVRGVDGDRHELAMRVLPFPGGGLGIELA